ncbi:hypothetical protein ACTXT7_013107, partial [Hymenolepis weldensis]
AEDEEEDQTLERGPSRSSDENEKKGEDEAKPAAPKVAKIEEPPKIQSSSSSTITSTREIEVEEEEAEEEAKKAADLLKKPQKDEIALRAKKHEEKEKEKSALLQKKEEEEKKQQEASEVKSEPERPPSPVTKASETVEVSTSKEESKPVEPEKTLEESVSPRQPSPPSSTSIPSTILHSSSQRNQVTEATVTLDTTNGVTSNGSTGRRISAVLAPARSEETEAQRSSKARMVRSTRRSTQGIASDVLEEARRLSSTAVPPAVSTTVIPSTTTTTTTTVSAAAIVTPTPVQGEEEKAERNLSFKSLLAKVEEIPTASLQSQPPPQSKNPPRQKSFASKVTLGYLSQPVRCLLDYTYLPFFILLLPPLPPCFLDFPEI